MKCPRIRTLFFVVWAVLLGPRLVRAADYDVRSGDWNGLQELVRVAQEARVELRPSATLDWSQVRRGDGLIILFPQGSIDLNDLSGFLEDGGRLALLDDFGGAAPLLRWFQVTRNEQPEGEARTPSLPGVLVAVRRAEHPLTEGVDVLLTNEPVAVHHTRLSPVFAFSEDPRQGLILAGQVGEGRLVIGGDPSVLINTMMRFAGNRQFAQNLLTYLAGGSGRVHLVHSGFTTRGLYRGRSRAGSPVRQVLRELDETLARLSTLGQDATSLRVLTLLLALATATLFALRTWGPRPSDRFAPSAPGGPAAGVADKVALFTERKANLLYPTLILKRYFERSLLRAVGLRPPTDVGAVLLAAQGRLNELERAELRGVLVDLDALSIPSHEGGPSRVRPRQFLSLWRRISAILAVLGDPVR